MTSLSVSRIPWLSSCAGTNTMMGGRWVSLAAGRVPRLENIAAAISTNITRAMIAVGTTAKNMNQDNKPIIEMMFTKVEELTANTVRSSPTNYWIRKHITSRNTSAAGKVLRDGIRRLLDDHRFRHHRRLTDGSCCELLRHVSQQRSPMASINIPRRP